MNTCLIAGGILALCMSSCLGANILAVLPLPSKSHHILLQPLFKELAKRGHNITTLVDEIHLKQPMENFTEIVITKSNEFKSLIGGIAHLFGPNSVMKSQNMFMITSMITQMSCKDTLNNTQVQKMLHSEQKFDLIMGEVLLGQECFVGLGHRFKAPVVAMTTFPGKESLEEYIGNPNPAAFLPNWITPYNDQMSFFQRGWNAFMITRQLHYVYFNHLPQQEDIMNKYIPSTEKMPPILDMLANISIVLHNSHIGITYARPYNPSVIEVGGMHIPMKRKPLPQDLKEFMDNAKEGVVYFSLGSAVSSHLMSDQVKQAFIKVFSKLKQSVLWKIDADTLPGLSTNVKLIKWLPQHEILAHENCKAFISHGGMLSVQEAIHFGVPLLGFPFFGDQPMNLAFVDAKGIGIKMDFDEITYESVSQALNEILNNPKYYNNMKKQSAIFNDHPQPPMEKAIYWIEYVLRHHGAPHLQTAAARMSWIKYFLLDVILVLLLVVVTILSIFMWIIVSLYKWLFSKKQHKD